MRPCVVKNSLGLFFFLVRKKTPLELQSFVINHQFSQDLSEDDLHLVTLMLHIHQVAGNVANQKRGGGGGFRGRKANS